MNNNDMDFYGLDEFVDDGQPGLAERGQPGLAGAP